MGCGSVSSLSCWLIDWTRNEETLTAWLPDGLAVELLFLFLLSVCTETIVDKFNDKI